MLEVSVALITCLVWWQYVLRDSLKNASGKDKSTYILVSKRDGQQLSDKPVSLASSVGTEISEEESGMGGNT